MGRLSSKCGSVRGPCGSLISGRGLGNLIGQTWTAGAGHGRGATKGKQNVKSSQQDVSVFVDRRVAIIPWSQTACSSLLRFHVVFLTLPDGYACLCWWGWLELTGWETQSPEFSEGEHSSLPVEKSHNSGFGYHYSSGFSNCNGGEQNVIIWLQISKKRPVNIVNALATQMAQVPVQKNHVTLPLKHHYHVKAES